MAKAIDDFQAYRYRYNIKIVGVPEKGTNESADETSGICVASFREMGTDVSINDIDTAHRVPGRNNSSQDPRPKPIICKFVRRLARDKVIANEPMPTKLILLPLASVRTCLLPPLECLKISHHDFKEFSMKQTNSRPSSISSIAGPRMVLFIFARAMNQEPFGLRMSVTSPDFKEGDKLIFFHS